ncbi:hypothetical protein ACE04B_09810, partial [Rhizobium phaseoli]
MQNTRRLVNVSIDHQHPGNGSSIFATLINNGEKFKIFPSKCRPRARGNDAKDNAGDKFQTPDLFRQPWRRPL